ncbi:MAG: transposase zinc-binding domain-containing protein [Thermodesulfobacteriota bacterium]
MFSLHADRPECRSRPRTPARQHSRGERRRLPPRPQDSFYYHCVEDHFETFERAYGFYRPYLRSVIYRYLDCGVLRNGFARVGCGNCDPEYLLAFFCKRGYFCPSYHQKPALKFGEWLFGKVLKRVSHRHFPLSIPWSGCLSLGESNTKRERGEAAFRSFNIRYGRCVFANPKT